jgi:hypothetical protein
MDRRDGEVLDSQASINDFLQHLRELILNGYVEGQVQKKLAQQVCNEIAREIERMASMKAEYRAEIKQEQEHSKWYQEGYFDGAMDGYDRALKDINKLRGVAVEEMLRGFQRSEN